MKEKDLHQMNKQEIMEYLNLWDSKKHRKEWRHIKVYDETKSNKYIED